MKWLYPDAHDANENIGQGLEAYFDENTKKWVFPGEDPSSAAPDPGSAPPPTGPIGGRQLVLAFVNSFLYHV